MAQKAGHRFRWPLTLAGALAAVASCTEATDTEPYVPARPAAVQPEASGSTLSEDEACERIRAAEEAARKDNVCEDLERPPCPFYIRPAGGGCWEYSEGSVAACEAAIAAYTSCQQFDDAPCVLSATPSDDPCPDSPITGGVGGAGGAGGAPAGGAPSGGGAGAGGAAGAPGAGGAAAGADAGGAAGATSGGAGGA